MSTVGRLAKNAAALFASSMMDRAATLFFYGIVARELGAFASGQISLGLTFVNAFQQFSGVALRPYLTRQISQRAQPIDKLIAGALLVVLALSALSIAVLNIASPLLIATPETARIVALLGFLVLPTSLSAVFEAVFHGRERMPFIALANGPMQLLRVIGTYVMLSRGYSLESVIYLLIAAYAGIALIEALLCFTRLASFGAVLRAFDPRFAFKLGRDSMTFVGIDAVVAFADTGLYLMIQRVAGEAQLGLVNAATQLISLATLVMRPLASGSYPVLCQQVQTQPAEARKTAIGLVRLIQMAMMPCAVGLVFFAAQGFELVHGNAEFAAAVPTMQILAFALVSLTFTSVLGQAIAANKQERYALLSVLVSAAVTLLSAALLLPRYGAIGAGIAMLAGKLVDAGLHLLFAKRALGGLPLGPALWQPALASAIMAAVIVLVTRAGLAPYPAIAVAIATYVAALGAILYLTHDSFGSVLRRRAPSVQP